MAKRFEIPAQAIIIRRAVWFLTEARVSRTIELPDEVYEGLERLAQERGVSVAEWIADNLSLPANSLAGRPLSELLEGLVGSVDSTTQRDGSRARTPFADLIADKFRRQGL